MYFKKITKATALLMVSYGALNSVVAQSVGGDTAKLDEVSITASGLKTSTRKMGYTTSQIKGCVSQFWRDWSNSSFIRKSLECSNYQKLW